MNIVGEIDRIDGRIDGGSADSAPEAAALTRHWEGTDRPLIITGGARRWPAVERWSPEHLLARLGAISLPHKLSATHRHPDFHQPSLAAMFARAEAPLDRFLRAITTGTAEERARRLFTGDEKFLLRRREGQTTVDPDLAPLLAELPAPFPYVPAERLYTVWAWMSGPGVRTWLHYDNNGCHNLNAQITGSKRCLLIPPGELARVYPFPLGGGNPAYNCSQVDVEAPDRDRFRAFAAVSAWQATLEAGDLLFIPAWWLHTFVHVGAFNCNVNFWWKPAQTPPSAVAARQTLLDVVAAAGIDAGSASPHAPLLRRLDEAAVGPAVLS